MARSWGFPRPIIKLHAEETVGMALQGSRKYWGFPFNIYTMAEVSDFEFGTQLGFASHHKITSIGKSGHGLGLEKLPKILWFYFNIYTMAEARDFKFGTQLGFAKVHHKTTPCEKVGVALGYIWGFPLILMQRPRCPLSVSGASCCHAVLACER